MNNYSMVQSILATFTVGLLTVFACVSGFEIWLMHVEKVWKRKHWRAETLPVIYVFLLSVMVIIELLPISARGFM